MSEKLKYCLMSVAGAALLGGCATAMPAANSHSETFGKANAVNAAAQHVQPTPAQKANTFIPADRSRREKARKRYREDDVEDPVDLRTNQ